MARQRTKDPATDADEETTQNLKRCRASKKQITVRFKLTDLEISRKVDQGRTITEDSQATQQVKCSRLTKQASWGHQRIGLMVSKKSVDNPYRY